MKYRNAILPILICAGILSSAVLSPVEAAGEDEEVLIEAKAALNDGFYRIAEEKFRTWLKDRDRAKPEQEAADVLNLYCRALDGQGRTGEIRKVAKTGSPAGIDLSGTAMSAYWTAYCDYKDGELGAVTNALAVFEARHGENAFTPNALRLKAWSLLGLGETNKAVEALVRFDEKFSGAPGSTRNLVELGGLLYKLKKYTLAEKYLRKLPEMDDADENTAHGYHLLGLVLRATGQDGEARSVFQSLGNNEDLAGDIRAEALFESAATGAATGDVERAVSECIKGLGLTSDQDLRMRGNILHGRALIDSGQLNEGIAILKQQVVKLTDHIQSAELQLEIAGTLLKSKKDEKAVAEFQFYLETFTNTAGLVDAHLGKGWGFSRLERYAEAAAEFHKAYQMSGTPSLREESLHKMGDSYFANGQYKRALDTYDSFLAEFGDSKKIKNVLFQRAKSLAGAGLADEAEKEFIKIFEKFPDEDLGAEALLEAGKIKFNRADAGAAIEDFESVMKRFPNTDYYVRALHSRAKAHFDSGDYESALRDLAKITEEYPDSKSTEDALYETGLTYQRMGRREDAEKAFARLLLAYPESRWAADVVFWQGEKAFNTGSLEKAEKVFMGFVEKYPESVLVPEALLRAGLAASGRNEYVRAIELFNRLAKEYPSSVRIPDARFAQANALCELGRFSEAILPLDEVINKYPESPLVMPAWGRKGDAHFTMGAEDAMRYEESIQCYRVVVASSKATRSMLLQSEYKIGRSLEKMGKTSEALERYYSRVMIPFLKQQKAGEKHDESARTWFTRASLDAARILEAQEDWKRAANVLERLAESGVPASQEAGARARKIRSEHWWLFY